MGYLIFDLVKSLAAAFKLVGVGMKKSESEIQQAAVITMIGYKGMGLLVWGTKNLSEFGDNAQLFVC